MPKRKFRFTPKKKADKKTTVGAKAPRKALGSTPGNPGVPSGRYLRKRKLDKEFDKGSHTTDDEDALPDADEVPSSPDDDETKLDYETDFAKFPLDAQWCRGCNDNPGSLKLTCDDCKHVVCYGGKGSGACLVLTPTAIKTPPWSHFVCPSCEHSKQPPGTKSPELVYQGFYDSNGTPISKVLLEIRNRQFTWFKPIKLEKLAIVQLQVAGAGEDFGILYEIAVMRASIYASAPRPTISTFLLAPNLPSCAQPSFLRPTFLLAPNLPSCAQPLLKSKIEFDFGTEEGMDRYAREMVNLRNAIDSMGIQRVVFLVVTHSDPDTGDIHFAPENTGAERLEVVMKTLFTPATEDWLRLRETYLFMIVCGSKPFTTDAYKYLQALVTSRSFENILLFPTVCLQPHELSSFLPNLLEHILFRHEAVEPMIPVVLKELSGLGLHTRILHLGLHVDTRGKPTCHAIRHVWTHGTRRPWGLDAPSYCSSCKSIKSFRGVERIHRGRSVYVQFKCYGSNCKNVITISLTPAESKLVRGPRDAYGDWQQHEFQWDEELLERF
ncbi:hypothetical protein K435DRAFT_798848 [Dendrothele bispora CBS 962.96]|uniref:Uncharacterized protein n=1 Tax=Dendrothele bispora (strain CBS 962.96) TaxID=1314807 RepID=A0A4S8LXT3_DENBC|nr:hypothetical protein K435DRAFT_798848 [Dendrothele bispora CBS 962.96]